MSSSNKGSSLFFLFLITLLNLFSGCIALVYASQENFEMAFFFVCLGIFFDFFDGFFARLFNVSSPLGLQLDSLADMVTSGVVPGFVMFKMLSNAVDSDPSLTYLPYFGFIITLGSCYRLANFNIDTRQSDSFIGVPTPTNAMFVASFYPILNAYEGIEMIENILLNDYFLIGYCLIMSYLLISELPLIALKFKTFAINENLYRYILIGGAVVLGIAFQYLAIPMVLVLYILLSVIQTLAHNK